MDPRLTPPRGRQVVKLQAEFAGGVDLARPGRHLLLQGTMSVVQAKGDPVAQTVLLFNDALLLADRTTLTGKLTVSAWWLVDRAEGGRSAEEGCIMHIYQGNDRLSLIAASEPERVTWLDALQELAAAREQELHSGCSFNPSRASTRGATPSFAKGTKGPSRLSLSFGGHAGGAATAARKGPDVVSASALLAGWLKKKGGGGTDAEKRNWAKGGRRNWKTRWVVVTSDQFIAWYESEKRTEVKGSLALHGAQVIASKREHGFWVTTNSRTLEMQANDAASAGRWIQLLQEVANLTPDVHAPGRRSVAGRASMSSPRALKPAAPPPLRRVRALFPYDAQEEGELTLMEGDVIEVISSEGEWWVGKLTDSVGGEVAGTFPFNYVEQVEIGSDDDEPPPPPQIGRESSLVSSSL